MKKYNIMENRLMTEDTVKVEIYFENNIVSEYTGTGFTEVYEAVAAAFAAYTGAQYSIETYTFRVSDISNGTSALYRFNAHKHLVLIPTFND